MNSSTYRGTSVVSSNTGAPRHSSNMSEAGALNSTAVKNEPKGSVEERRARKREQDRLCQRRKREKDRENLRRLEARLDGLQNADDSKTVLDLILRHEQDQAKIDRQVERLRQLQSVLQAGLQDLAKDATKTVELKDEDSQSPELDTIAGSAILHAPNPTSDLDGSSTLNQPLGPEFEVMSMPSAVYGSLPVFNDYNVTASLPQAGAATTSTAYIQPIGAPRPDANSPWVCVGNVIEDACKRVEQSRTVAVITPESVDQHILLTVCLQSWDHAVPFIELNHALWQCLRQVDEVVLSTWNPMARMSSLWSMWRTMKANSQGPQATAALEPKFLRPRPSQLHIPHRPDIDYFVWPGVRERLVFESDKYYNSESFLRVFSASTCFLWPFSLVDTHYQDKNTRLLQFSPEFSRRLHNINSWSIDTAFLAEYPEFVGDIPTYNSIPPKVEEKPSGSQFFYFQNNEDETTVPTSTRVVGNWVYNGNGYVGKNDGSNGFVNDNALFDQVRRGGPMLGGVPR